MEKNFIRVRSINDIVIFTSLIAGGFILTVIFDALEIDLVGYVLMAIGVLGFCFLKSGYKDIETQEKYLAKEFSFPGNMKTSILSALALSPEAIDLTQEGKGSTLMLKIYYSKAAGKAYLQLFEFIPHQYEPCSEMYEYEIDKIANLLN